MYLKKSFKTLFNIFLSTSLVFFKQIIIAKFLLPEEYAFFSIVNLSSIVLMNFGAFGIYYYTNYKIRKNLNDKIKIKKYQSQLISAYLFLYPLSIIVVSLIFNLNLFDQIFVLAFFSFSYILFTIIYLPISLINHIDFSFNVLRKNIISFLVCVIIAILTKNILLTIFLESLSIYAYVFIYNRINNFTIKFDFKILFSELLKSKNYFFSTSTATILFLLVRSIASNTLNKEELGNFFLGFLLVYIAQQVQYSISVIFTPTITEKLNKNKISNNYLNKIWFFLLCFAFIFYFILFNLRIYFYDFFPNYKSLEILFIPFCILGISKMIDIWSIYFVLANKIKLNFYSNLSSIFFISLCFFYMYSNNLNNINNFYYLVLIEGLCILFFPIIFFNLKHYFYND